MQVSQISSLTTAMTRYCTAVQNMEQVVMFPSLLREVPLEQEDDETENQDSRDLYEHYTKLKTMRISLENGLVPVDDKTLKTEEKVAGTVNNEALFYHHFTGLLCTLSQLTKESNALTSKYKDLIGMAR
ncbi:thyroid hormone-inducible hepatic protein [Rhinophrynus dorsalis]